MQLPPLPLIADGAPGRLLAARHAGAAACPEALNLTHPDLVRGLHGTFRHAGADLLRTNTRAAQSIALAEAGLVGRAEAINNSGSALVREVAGAGGLVMGSVGAIPQAMGASKDEREQAYGEQLVYLADTGVTFILLEHFDRAEEAERVTAIARRTGDAPVLAQLRFTADGRTGDGLSCGDAAKLLLDAGAEALGISCGPAPRYLPAILDVLQTHGVPVSLLLGVSKPAATSPCPGAAARDGDAFADALELAAERGVAIVGGCCGADEGHVAAVATRLGKSTSFVSSAEGNASA